MKNRIELMVVAAGAAIGEAEESRSHRIRDIVQNFLAALHQIASIALVGIVAIKTGRDPSPGIVREKLIAGDLFLNKTVVRLIFVERSNHVIAITPGVRTGFIGFETVALGVTG